MTESPQINQLADHLFRHEAGKMVAVLTRIFGPDNIDLSGRIISGHKGTFKDGPFNESKELIIGYYHILAKDLDEAIEIAKGNPELEYTSTARVEVRPIKMMEESTGYTYPKG